MVEDVEAAEHVGIVSERGDPSSLRCSLEMQLEVTATRMMMKMKSGWLCGFEAS